MSAGGSALPLLAWIILAAADRPAGYPIWYLALLLIAVLAPLSAASWFFSRCWAYTETTGRRCRHRRQGLLYRCHEPTHRFSIYDLWGVLAGGVFLISLVVVVNEIAG